MTKTAIIKMPSTPLQRAFQSFLGDLNNPLPNLPPLHPAPGTQPPADPLLSDSYIPNPTANSTAIDAGL